MPTSTERLFELLFKDAVKRGYTPPFSIMVTKRNGDQIHTFSVAADRSVTHHVRARQEDDPALGDDEMMVVDGTRN